MSPTRDSSGKGSGHKTLAIRLDPDMHAQLSILAQLSGSTITDEIRQAIEDHLDRKRSAPELAAQASAVLEEIERDADTRREAIATLFGKEAPAPPKAPRPRGGRKATSDEPDSTS